MVPLGYASFVSYSFLLIQIFRSFRKILEKIILEKRTDCLRNTTASFFKNPLVIALEIFKEIPPDAEVNRRNI